MDDMFPPNRGGFMAGPMGVDNRLVFCQGINGAGLTLLVMPSEQPAQPTLIKLDLNLDRETNPCGQLQRMHRNHMHMSPMHTLFPTMAPPRGVRQNPGGGGGGGDSVHTSAKLVDCQLPLEQVAVHYSGQLSRAGWTKTSSGQSDQVAWQNWSFSDDEQQPWTALFIILHVPAQKENYLLFAWANAVDSVKNIGSGSFGYGMSSTSFGMTTRSASSIQFTGSPKIVISEDEDKESGQARKDG
jgi:hypothetical protein